MRFSKPLLLAFCLGVLASCGGGGGGGDTGGGGGDTTVPAVALTVPTAGASVTGVTTVTASASDNVGVARVVFYVNDALQTTDTAAPYGFDWNTVPLAAGPYTLKAIAYDAAGNSATSSTVAVTVIKDTTLPTVSITSPTAAQTVTGTVNLTADASDDAAVSRVEFYVNNVLQGTDSAAPYSHNWDTSALARGSYTLSAKAYDTSGNVRQSADIVVTVPIWTSMTTVVSNSTAVGTVVLHGISVPDAYGLDLVVTAPGGATVASASSSGPYAATAFTDPTATVYANSNVASGEIMKVNFAGVPAGATADSFGISILRVFDGAGVQIQ